MNILEVEAFLAIVSLRNLTKAAKALFVTQSTVSHRLKKLEEELQTELIVRNKGARMVELTRKGEQFIPLAKRWAVLWKETQQLREVENYYNLYIAQVDWFQHYPVFSKLFQGIAKEQPFLKMDITTSHTMPIYSMVSNLEADIGFVVRYVSSPNITHVPLFRDPLVLVCSKDANLPNRPIRPRELDARNEIYWGYFRDYRHWHDKWWDPNIIPYVAVDFSIPMSFEFLSNPNLWLISPRSIAEKMVKQLDLSIHTLTDPPPDIVCYMIQNMLPAPTAVPGLKQFNLYLETHLKSILEESSLISEGLEEDIQ